METRREPRTPQSEMVRVFGLDPAGKPINVDVYTVDISYHGARLKDIHVWQAPGDTIGLRRGPEKARFKIVWVGKAGTASAGHVGLSSLDYDKLIWDATPAQTAAKSRTLPGMPPAAAQLIPRNRRKHLRFRAQGTAAVTASGSAMAVSGVLRDLSAGGCFVDTPTPLFDGTRIGIAVHVGAVAIEARGHVTLYRRLVGMGVQFDEMSPAHREQLDRLVEELRQAQHEESN